VDCPPVRELVTAVETDDFGEALGLHLGNCMACSDVVSALRQETEGLSISVGALWIREGITCPHDDILLAFTNGGLDAEESDFIRFHLETVECPRCMSRSEELAAGMDSKSTSKPRDLNRALDESMARSAAFRDELRED
jgi:hypothetical protein